MQIKISASFKLLASAALAMLVVLAMTSDGFAQLKGLEKAAAVKFKAKGNLFKIDGVAAAGIGSDEHGNAIVKVFTDKPNVNGIPGKIDGVAVKVEFVGPITAWDDSNKAQKGKPDRGGLGSRSRHPRPVPIGVSVGTDTTAYCFAGTLGCRLKQVDLNSGNTVGHFMLSNNHVFAEENAGSVGVDNIIQPGTLDNNCVLDPADQIGVLYDFVPLLYGGQTNYIDAAIATTTTSDVGTATPSAGWGNPTSVSASAFVGQIVQKYGRTTAFTEGTVDSVGVSVNVGYDGGTAAFDDQVVIRGRRMRGKKYVASSFSDSGDSGSLIVDQNNNPVALLFAGNSTITIGCPIDAVLNAFSDVQGGTMMFVDDGN